MARNPNPDPSRHAEIPVWNMETWLYEDLAEGQRTRSIRRTISEGEAMLFNGMVMDLHPYVADEPFALEEGNFGRRLVAGAQVFSYGLGLFAHNNVNTFSYGYDRLRFIRPVFIGDTIYGIRTMLRKEPKYPRWDLAVFSYEVFKHDGELVLYCEHLQTVKYRDAAAAGAPRPAAQPRDLEHAVRGVPRPCRAGDRQQHRNRRRGGAGLCRLRRRCRAACQPQHRRCRGGA